MAYFLELWNTANAVRLGQFSKVIGTPAMVLELEGENTLNFELDGSDPLASSLGEKKYVRAVKEDATTTYYSFIIQAIDYEYIRSKVKISVRCEGLKYALIDKIVKAYKEYANIACSTILTEILAGSGFTVGTVNPASTNLKNITYNWPNILEALQMLVDTYYYDDLSSVRQRYHYRVNETKAIDILEEANLGSVKNFYINYDKQIKAMSKSSDAKQLVNRVVGVGAEGFSIQRAGLEHYIVPNSFNQVADASSQKTYLIDASFIKQNDLYNNFTLGLNLTATGAAQKSTITDTTASNNRLIVNFDPEPAAGDDYSVGYLDEEDTWTYTLGSPGGSTKCAALGTSVVLSQAFSTNFTSGDAADTCDMIYEVQILDADDEILITGEFTESVAYVAGFSTRQVNAVINIGTIANGRKIKMTFKGSTFSTGSGGNAFIELYSLDYFLANNVTYIDDSTSQSTYGIIEGKYENTEIVDTINLVATPALDGTYTGGLCQDWIACDPAAATFSENTNPAYIKNGTKSQKIVALGSSSILLNAGFHQNIAIKPNIAYSFFIWVYVDPDHPCPLNIQLESSGGTTILQQTSGVGWHCLTIEGFSYSACDLKLSVYLEFFTAADQTFYVDSAQVAEGAEVKPFVDGDSADVLYGEAENYLKQNCNPLVSYGLDLKDLYEIDPVKYAAENFGVGDSIRVVDADIPMALRLLVVRKEFNPFKPQDCKVVLSNRKDLIRKTLLKAIDMRK